MAFESFGTIIDKLSAIILGLNIDQWSAIIFVVVLGLFLFANRKKIVLQKLLFPLFYIIMYRTKLGLKLMDKLSTKYREQVKLFGYCAIGLGFVGMIYVSLSILMMLFSMVFQPKSADPGMALVLPFTNIPGIGYLSFWHWIIAIFILAVIHEFAHGVVARAHGVEIKSSGFAVFGVLAPILPAAFVEPDEKKLNKEPDIVQYSVFAAGPVINILLAVLIVIALPYTADISGRSLAPFENHFSEPVGLSYKLLNETLPAAKSGMQDGMIITAVNNETVKDYSDFLIFMMRVKPNETITLTANGTIYTLTTAENPSNKQLSFIGIVPEKNERRIIEDKETTGAIFYWFKGLFKWLFLLNLFIGLANLLPLGIVDGGRMLKIALDKSVKDKNISKKIWTLIAILFIAIMIFGLIVTYVGNPFSYFW